MDTAGVLSAVVWPQYIGLATNFIEPDSPDYQRGQIDWQPANGTIEGSAGVWVPPGMYTHFAFYRHPTELAPCGYSQLPHPIFFHEKTFVDIRPIRNGDFVVTEQISKADSGIR